MKNKLLLSTALVGGLALTGIANAQTTVTGEINLSWKSSTNEGTNTNITALNRTNQNDSGFGRETQLNIQNKGKLNNGIDYAAGFSLEFDGLSGSAQSGTTTIAAAADSRITRLANENVFIDLIFGTTTVSVGSDHLNNMSFSAVPRVAQHMGTTLASAQMDISSTVGNVAQANTAGGGTAYKYYSGGASLGASNYLGVGVQQVTPMGTITAQYFPKASAQAAGNDGIARTSNLDAYEIHYRGDLGVKGLTATAGYNMISGNGATGVAGSSDQKGKAIGVGYNFGQFAIGAQKNWTDNGGDTTAKVDISSVELGATFAATKDITLGVQKVTTQGRYFTSTDMPKDETATAVSIGYNLGAISSSLTYSQLKDARGIGGANSDILLARAGIKF